MTAQELSQIRATGQPTLLFFWASWLEEALLKDLREAVDALVQRYPTVLVHSLDAEENPELSSAFQVSLVPCYCAFHGPTVVGRVEGANPAAVVKLVKQLAAIKYDPSSAAAPTSSSAASPADVTVRLKQLIYTAPVMLFMKGAPAAPKCGFSRQICEILKEHAIPFASFDILGDEDVRTGLKALSDWPTYPQLYVSGEFVGGLDIVKELAAGGDLKKELGVDKLTLPPDVPTPLEERLKQLINRAPVMLFMKGAPDAPKCGFSRTIVEMLREADVPFSSFDILGDEDVRAGLKTFSDWPTYPQLYAKGDLVGGLDIVKEMAASGPLKAQLL